MAIQKTPKKKEETKNKVLFGDTPRFGLEKYKGLKSRYTCPSCGRHHSFVRYVDKVTGLYIGEQFGRCNRETSCGYHLVPKISDLPKDAPLVVNNNEIKEEFIEKDFINVIDSKFVIKSLEETLNSFTYFLYNNFPKESVDLIIKRYYLGTTDKWGDRAVIFWQIDQDYNSRTGKIMLYNRETGKRVKEPINRISWVHRPNKSCEYGNTYDYNLSQVFFGEHLINTPNVDTFHIVESEKTAVICSIMKPESYWLATGGLNNIKGEKLLPYADKKLIFYPDKGDAFNKWQAKLSEFIGEYDIEVSDFLEKQKNVKEGEDMADYLLKKLKQRNGTNNKGG